MRKVIIILVCLLVMSGCKSSQSNQDSLQKIGEKFSSEGYRFSYGGSAVIISDANGDAVVATFEEKNGKPVVSEMVYMNEMSGDGVYIYLGGGYKELPSAYDGDAYYKKYQQLLDTIDISEKELFEFCVYDFEGFIEAMNKQNKTNGETQ